MNIIITGRNVNLTPRLKKYAEDKIARFDKYLPGITEATVTLSVQKLDHKAEVVLTAKGVTLTAEGSTGELFSAIDDVVDKLQRQVGKHKDKRVTQRKAETAKSRTAAEAAPRAPEDKSRLIVRKPFVAKPMTPEEAALNLEMSDMAFFVFTDHQSGSISVIYRMASGGFGLIEPA